MKNIEREKKSEFQSTAKGLPEKKGRYTIKLSSGKVIHGVEYENGMFWKMRKGGGGQTWPAVEYRKESGYERRG